mmetsp:Transcript_28475/g.72014  ORF Transcript_28475/g.72014 Transcript_28475/m.72014 type:complete len:207 (-) Transcript_28475:177-797(-)
MVSPAGAVAASDCDSPAAAGTDSSSSNFCSSWASACDIVAQTERNLLTLEGAGCDPAPLAAGGIGCKSTACKASFSCSTCCRVSQQLLEAGQPPSVQRVHCTEASPGARFEGEAADARPSTTYGWPRRSCRDMVADMDSVLDGADVGDCRLMVAGIAWEVTKRSVVVMRCCGKADRVCSTEGARAQTRLRTWRCGTCGDGPGEGHL